jgi:DNA-binding NtrC family response regulator
VPNPASHGRILVIDDEESLRLALTKGLVRLGFEAEAVATGKEGVDRFTAGGWDAVLTDVRLPDLSGLDVVAVLTEMDADVPVVVMTGYGTVETALEALRRGAKDYVQKPFSVDEVGRVVARAIEERRLSHENRRLRALVERRFAQGGYEQVEAELATRRPPEATNGTKPAAAGSARPAGGHPGNGAGEDEGPIPLREAQRRFEVRYVADLLARTGGNIAAAARLAGISRPNFHKKLRSLGVDPSGFKQAARRGRIAQL